MITKTVSEILAAGGAFNCINDYRGNRFGAGLFRLESEAREPNRYRVVETDASGKVLGFGCRWLSPEAELKITRLGTDGYRTMDDVKPGDKLLKINLRTGSGTEVTVARVTRTQIILGDGGKCAPKFWKGSRQEVGTSGDWHRVVIEFPEPLETEEELAQEAARVEAARALRRLKSMRQAVAATVREKVLDADMETLQAVAELLGLRTESGVPLADYYKE